MDKFAAIAGFAQVVEAGSFSGAAQRSGLSKSALSKQVAHLEEQLGARLLNRTTRRLSLTEVGAAFYERCTRIVHEMEEAELAVSHLHATPRGVLKVNAPMTFGHLHLAPAIADFLVRYPEIRVDLALSDRIVDPIEGGFDVTIRVAVLPDSRLIARRLAPNRLVVCGAPEYFDRHGEPRTPEELARHNCLNYTYLSKSHDLWRFVGPRGEQSVRVSGNFKANNGDTLQAAAIAGLGLVWMPTFIVGASLQAGALRAVLVKYEDRTTSIWALYPRARHLAPKVRAFVDFLAARFGRHLSWDGAPGTNASAARRARSRGAPSGI
jgi:DNA-binding transcriptional LysR family regulator